MSKRLIINADDFGFDPDATAGILTLLERGKISSTTVMANLVKSQDLINLTSIPKISIGWHVNLLDGKPSACTSEIPSLVGENGEFVGAKKLFQNALLGKIAKNEIKKELQFQFDFLKDHGISPSHADSHQHLHQFPILGKMIREILVELGIKKIRNSAAVENTLHPRSIILAGFTRFSPIEKSKFSTTEGLIAELSFGGEIEESKFLESIKRSFRNHSTLELMTHPGLQDKPGSYLARKLEFDLWSRIDTREVLARIGVNLVNFGDL